MGPVRAFTARCSRLARTLESTCKACQAFDPAALHPSQHPAYQDFKALWDTGASGTVITDRVIAACNLKPIGMKLVHHAQGSAPTETYLINVALPNGVNFKNVEVTRGVLRGFDMLIGIDIIGMGDLAVSNFGGKTTFTFRYPSQRETDYVIEAGGPGPPQQPGSPPGWTGGRNSPCFCGSGKKFKRCHGQ